MSTFPSTAAGRTRDQHRADHEQMWTHFNASINAADYSTLQAAIDAAETQVSNGGVVYIPPGTYTIDAPLILPRTGSSPTGAVHLIGAGRYQTIIAGSGSFPTDRALIEWDAVASRAWEQKISGIGFSLPSTANVRAIHFEVTDNTSWSAVNDERFQLDLEDIYITCHNDYHPVLIKIEGICNYSSIRRIYGDPVLGSGTYDTLLLQADYDFDGTPPNYADAPGFYHCDLSHLYGMVRRGGQCATFEGRLFRSRMTDCFANGGKDLPNFNFINSLNSVLENLSTEGQGEKPQMRFDTCEFMDGRNFGFGTPNAIGDSGVGNGVELIGCEDCRFDGRIAVSGNPAFSASGVYLVAIDSDCKRNTFTRWGVRPGVGGVAGEFSIAGTANTIGYIDVLNDVTGTLP